ncbi:carbamate kinase [bacterium]|nr:carbamate kinase [bacterium]
MKIVIALGGNALIRPGDKGTIEEQEKRVATAVDGIMPLIEKGHQVVITHGNGPQAGARLIRNEMAETEVYPDPLVICVADTQGSIGYMIEQALINNLLKKEIRPKVATLVTQIEVNQNDPAFQKPTKPVGPFYTQQKAIKKMKKGWIMAEDSGRGFRRLVPSPRPLRLVSPQAIETLINADFTVITGGGGGIPVFRNAEGVLVGIDAVIDKDFASVMIAKTIEADMLVILTGVEKVALNFRSENPTWVDTMTVRQAKAWLTQGEFPAGSMGPKITAAADFVASKRGRTVLITSEDKLTEAIEGKTGTRVVSG